MKYLQAKRQVDALNDHAEPVSVLIASSFQSEAWAVYVKALYAGQQKKAHVDHLPFGSLHQHMRSGGNSHDETLLIVNPWDFYPMWNWRLGYQQTNDTIDTAIHVIQDNIRALLAPSVNLIVYIDAPVKPLFSSRDDERTLHAEIHRGLKALTIPTVITRSADIEQFLLSGQLLNGKQIGEVIDTISHEQTLQVNGGKKVLVTDLDNTLWAGVIGEDGADGIQYRNEATGYPHYLYQSLLKVLKERGALLAAVSKNDEDLARTPFKSGNMVLAEEDFVAVAASYEAKSAQILELSEALDLPTSSFVFVDDNPVELQEVCQAIPDIETLLFKPDVQTVGDVLQALLRYFPVSNLTEEDSQRTTLYRTRIQAEIHRPSSGSDITDYLRSLGMTLKISKQSIGTHQRALQLINKTNQFNLNGRRLTENELVEEIESGAELWTAELTDQFGSHGDVISCLIQQNQIRYLVMSCRVLNREAEYAFLNTLHSELNLDHEMCLRFQATDRNTPMQKFIQSLALDSNYQAGTETHERLKRASSLFKVTLNNDC